MSAESERSSEQQRPPLQSIPSIVLREMAESTRNHTLLNGIQFVAVERALDDENDLISASLALFVERKYVMILEEVWETGQPLDDESDSAWMIPRYYEKTDQHITDSEEAHIHLFKHPEE